MGFDNLLLIEFVQNKNIEYWINVIFLHLLQIAQKIDVPHSRIHTTELWIRQKYDKLNWFMGTNNSRRENPQYSNALLITLRFSFDK